MASGQEDILNSCHRGRPKKKPSREEHTKNSDNPTEAAVAPTFSITLAKAKAEIETWKVKAQYLEEKIEDLTKERDYLREQLSEAIKMDNMPDKIKEKPADKRKKISWESEKESSDSDSSESSDSESSSSDTSRERKKRKKPKKVKKRVKKQKKNKRSKFCQRVTEPRQVVKRYRSVLDIFSRGSNMTDAFRKYGVDRNTIVQSAAIAELAIAAPEKYAEILEKQKGEKLSNINQKCHDAILADENIANKIQTMKSDGKLLPIKK